MHFGAFRLADDGQDEPPTVLAQERDKAGLDPAAFRILALGESLEIK